MGVDKENSNRQRFCPKTEDMTTGPSINLWILGVMMPCIAGRCR